MKLAITAFVALGTAAIFAIWPGAQIAQSSYSVAIVPPTDPVRLAMLNPYSSAQFGSLQLSEVAPFAAPLLAQRETPLAALSLVPPMAAVPTAPAIPAELVPAAPEAPVPDRAPEAAQAAISPAPIPAGAPLDNAKPVVKADPALHEALAAPRDMIPQEPRSLPPRRHAARPLHADTLRVRFEGPAGAPFAHTRFCIKYPGECRVHKTVFRGGPITLSAERRKQLLRINTEVNRSIVATNMNEPVAQELWVISPKAGDCNDYAVTKRHKLMALGWPARDLLLAEVITSWGEHHLVLVVRTSEGDLVADNLNANVRNWTKTAYDWVRVESPVNPMFWSKIAAPQLQAVAMVSRDSQL